MLVGILAIAALGTSACSSGSSQNASQTTAPAQTQTAPSNAAPSSTAPAAAQLQIKDIVVGKGAVAKTGDQATVDYTGWLMDGTKFDSSIGKQPFSFVLGQGQVIEGWDQGVVGMKVGGTRQLIIPPQLGYGDQGAGGTIPPNATLKFEVKLLSLKPSGQ